MLRHIALPAAALALASLAACQDRDPVSPAQHHAAPAASSAPRAALFIPLDKADLTVRLWNPNTQQFMGGLSVTFTVDSGRPMVVPDNGASDLDSRPGYLKFRTGRGATYKACITVGSVPKGYAWQSSCNTRYSSGGAVDMGSLLVHELPRVLIETKSMLPNAKAVGASFYITDADVPGVPARTLSITDGGAGDNGPFGKYAPVKDGRVEFHLPTSGKYSICETAPPEQHKLAAPACWTVDGKFDIQHVYQPQHEYIPTIGGTVGGL
jgi:hypothetical protein